MMVGMGPRAEEAKKSEKPRGPRGGEADELRETGGEERQKEKREEEGRLTMNRHINTVLRVLRPNQARPNCIKLLQFGHCESGIR